MGKNRKDMTKLMKQMDEENAKKDHEKRNIKNVLDSVRVKKNNKTKETKENQVPMSSMTEEHQDEFFRAIQIIKKLTKIYAVEGQSLVFDD
jgi:hypothetical protein